ncbi:divergent CRAL/TRIO domain-containing protein [Dipodascopsis uninucleata]
MTRPHSSGNSLFSSSRKSSTSSSSSVASALGIGSSSILSTDDSNTNVNINTTSTSNNSNRTVFSEIELRNIAEKILYSAGIEDPITDTPLYILNATALPSPQEIDYSLLLPYLIQVVNNIGDYSLIAFAGGAPYRPSWTWMIHTYSTLNRDIRKRLKRLYIVHEGWWVRTIMEMIAGAVSVKFRQKVVHISNLSVLAQYLDIRFLPISLAVYVHDRRLQQRIEISTPYTTVFGRDLPRTEVIPTFWKQALDFLMVNGIYADGIFRVSPKHDLVDILREAFDRCQLIDLNEYGVHVTGSVIKLYLRLLPTPPLPHALMNKFPDFIPSLENTIEVANALPRQTIVLFSGFIPLLRAVAMNERSTRMSVINLARCITPSLIRTAIATEEAASLVTYNGSSSTLEAESGGDQNDVIYITDPLEMSRILEYNSKLFECLIYYWNELPFNSDNHGNGNDENDRRKSQIGKDGSNTLQSLGHLPPPLPSRPFSAPTSSQNTSAPRDSDNSPSSSINSSSSSISVMSSNSDAPTTPTSLPSSPLLGSHLKMETQLPTKCLELNEDRGCNLHEQKEIQFPPPKLNTAIQFSYSSKAEPEKKVTPALRKKPSVTLRSQKSNSSITFTYTTSGVAENDKPYVPMPSTFGTSTSPSRSFSSNSVPTKPSKVSVLGGFRCISADSVQHTQVLRSVSPYVTSQSNSTNPKKVKANTSVVIEGKENSNSTVPVSKSSSTSGQKRDYPVVSRKKGRLIEQLSKIYEERSQSVDLLVQLGSAKQ